MGAPGFALGANLANEATQRAFQRNEEQRIAARNDYVDLQKNVLNNPNLDPNDPALNDIKDPTAKQAEIDRRVGERQKATNNIAGAFQPQEHGSLFKVLSGLIHGAPAPPNTATAIASQPVSTAAPTAPETNGPQLPDGSAAPVVKDALGIPISDPTVAAAHQQPMHPMAKGHAVIDRIQEGLDALGNHLKGAAAGFNPPQHVNDVSNLAAGYQSPIITSRQTAELAAQHAQELAQTKGELNIEGRRVTAGGSSAQARYIRAVAQEKGKEPGDLTPEEMQQAIEEYGQANRRPQTIVNPTDGIVSIITRDTDGTPVAAPMRDRDGQLFGGFKPNTVTIRNGVYHFIGADNQVHEVPVTTTSTKIFGPHYVGEDKPLQVPKADPDAQATPISAAPAAPPPPSGKGLQRRGAAIKAPPTVAPTAASTAPTYPGKTLGPSKLNAADRGVLESDQQLTDSVGNVLPILEKLKDRNSIMDRAKMELAWQQYQHGIEPSDPQLGEVIRNVALLQIQGAAPWTRIGRSKYTFDVIQKHLPAPTDTPKLLYDKVKWLKDNVIPSSINATMSPAGVGPTSKNAPKPPGSTQSLADRLNEALGAAKPNVK